MNLLFVCTTNRLRSATAEAVFFGLRDHAVLSAGTRKDADVIISAELVEWADITFVMEDLHRREAEQRFGPALHYKRLTVLDIPDRYKFMDPNLVEQLLQKMAGHMVEEAIRENPLPATVRHVAPPPLAFLCSVRRASGTAEHP